MLDWLFGKKEDKKEVVEEDTISTIQCDHNNLNPSNTTVLMLTPRQRRSEIFLSGIHESLCECNTCGKLFCCSTFNTYYTSSHQYRELTNDECQEYIAQCVRSGIERNAILIGRLMKRAGKDSKVTSIVKSEGNKISCLDGYAVKFDNGSGFCVIDNVIVPDKWIFHKEDLTADDFIRAQNMEERKRLTQIIGEENLKTLLGNSAKELNSFSLKNSNVTLIYRHCGGIDMKMLKMQNNWDNSPYYLFVPPWIRTAKEGVAWSFYQDPSDYKPVVEA